jgi:flagellar biosynthesis/type III secretory pathway chaperone
VRLTAGGRTVEMPLVIEPDPRVKVPSSALDEQFQLASRLSAVLSESSRTVLTAQSERAQIQSLADVKNPAIAGFSQRLGDLVEPLAEAQSNVDTLYKQVVKGDAAPTAALRAASDSEAAKLAPLSARWKQLQTELPAVNKALRAAHRKEIRAELPPPRDQNVADEE